MVTLHAICHVSHPCTSIFELVADKDNLVASLDKTLRQLIPMSLDTSKLREGEVSADQDAILTFN